MSDELTERIARILGRHQHCEWDGRKRNPAMTCGAPLPDVYDGANIAAAHQAEQVRDALGIEYGRDALAGLDLT